MDDDVEPHLTLVESLVLDQITARRRLGEPCWTFERTSAMTKALNRLADHGYLSFEQDPAGNWRVHLNEDPDGPAAKWAVPLGERCYRDHTDDDWKPTPPVECPPVESRLLNHGLVVIPPELAEQYDATLDRAPARRAHPALHLLAIIVGIAVAVIAALATAAPAAACTAFGVGGVVAGHALAKAFGWAP